jgi:photosystem II stability/assembly factor-like uncharacterized protein
MRRPSLLCTLSLLLVLPSLAAAADSWTPFGPAGFPLTGFVAGASGQLFVSSAANGVLASDDGGRSWARAGAGMGTARVQALAAGSDGTLYASGAAAFFRSTDDGITWTALSRSLPLGSPVESGDLLAVASTGQGGVEVFLARDNVLVRSVDGGATWQKVLGEGVFSALLIDPNDPRSVFAATVQGGGMFHSADSGATWAPVTQVEPVMSPPFDSPFSFGVLGLAAVPTSPSTLFAEMNLSLYRSTDGGVSWHLLPPTPAPSVGYIYALTVLPGSPAIVYTLQQLISSDGFAHAGIFASRDLGETWTRVDQDPDGDVPFAARLVVQPGTGDLFAQDQGILAQGAQGGAHWATRFQVFDCSPSPEAFELLRWSSDGSRIYAQVGGSLSMSRDGGRSWIARPQSLACVADFRVDPAHAETLYAGGRGGVYASRNGGATWKSVFTSGDPRSELFLGSIAVPRSGRIVVGGCGMWLSGDSGATWTKTLGCAVHRPAGDFMRNVSRLLVDPLRPDVLYANLTEIDDNQRPPAVHVSILRSLDGGRSWRTLIDSFGVLAIDPRTPTTLYLAAAGQIRRSTDDGRTWQILSNPGPGAVQYDLLVSPADSRTLYASGTLGVFRSRDGGLTWQAFGAGLAGRTPFHLFLNPGASDLFTGADGLFKMRLARPLQ